MPAFSCQLACWGEGLVLQTLSQLFVQFVVPALSEVAAMHFLSYGPKKVNVQWEWDISHWLNNASKGALRCHPLFSFAHFSPRSQFVHFSRPSPALLVRTHVIIASARCQPPGGLRLSFGICDLFSEAFWLRCRASFRMGAGTSPHHHWPDLV